MKYFVLLFSVYLILLGVTPCQDRDDMVTSAQFETVVHRDAAKGEHAGGEMCPPFCSCACCSVAQHFPLEKTTTVVVPVFQQSYPGFYCSDLKKQPVDVWQPPKLV
ncbi:DUF6660 family protein [Pedobacter roseus]|uniref:Uncharacterized protein n=1 Tax=Pedobacter roseus TaxID=336820 RepID=A0A7G9Q9W1_9SPHI|nr:DUF6660 family protein [Pedobacter roseus]QNN40136.1 hypothetical protein H9L23_13305 [Pedobacter roseus]